MIDSNILCFYAIDNYELTAEVRDILSDYGNRIYVPSKCVEELIYLQQSGKIDIKEWKNAENIIRFINESNFDIKYVAEEHLRTLARLPLIGEHKDMTDRMAIAQAITEEIPIISSDRKFRSYEKHGLRLVFNDR